MKKLKYFVIILAIIAGIFLISSKAQAVELVEDDTTTESTEDKQEKQITWTDPSKINISLERRESDERYYVGLNVSGLKKKIYIVYILLMTTLLQQLKYMKEQEA